MITILMLQLENAKRRMDERGASAVEYGLLVAGIAAIIVAIVFFLGDNIQAAFQGTCETVGGEMAENGTEGANATCE